MAKDWYYYDIGSVWIDDKSGKQTVQFSEYNITQLNRALEQAKKTAADPKRVRVYASFKDRDSEIDHCQKYLEGYVENEEWDASTAEWYRKQFKSVEMKLNFLTKCPQAAFLLSSAVKAK